MPGNFLMRSQKMTRKLLCSAGNRLSGAACACLLLGAIVLLCATLESISRADSMPEWLAALIRVDLNHFGDGSAAVVVDQWNDFTVDTTGKFVSIERKALRALDRRSAERYLTAAGLENNDSTVVCIQTW